MEVEAGFLNEIFGQDTHAGTYLDDIGGATGEAVDNARRNALVGEEMLSEELLGFYFVHFFNAL
jgi:hypothetical protein